MNVIRFMDIFPLWGVFIASIVLIMLATELGFLLGRRAQGGKSNEEKVHTGTVVGAALGLLAFMLAFTFGTAATSLTNART